MKKLLLIIALLLSLSLGANGQRLQEKRVYYLDITGSMQDKFNIWDSVRENLKKAINAIEDPTTEIELITFTDSNHYLDVAKSYASSSGKRELCKKIDDLSVVRECHTDVFYPLEDFYQKRIDRRKRTYMFLMTDGEQYDKNEGKIRLENALKKWRRIAEYNNNIYGFYINLSSVQDPVAKAIIPSMNPYHLWQINTADVNINLVSLDESVIHNIREGREIDIHYTGKLKPTDIQLNGTNDYYRFHYKIHPDKNKITLTLNPTMALSQTPDKTIFNIMVQKNSSDRFTFITTDQITLTCNNKKEKILKIRIS